MNKMRPDRVETGRLRDFALACLARHGELPPDEDQAVRAALADMHMLRAGSELTAEGAAHHPALMLDGWALRQRVLSDGRRQIFGFVLPGDLFGLSACRGAGAAAGMVALTPVTVAPLPLLAESMHSAPQSALGRLAWEQIGHEERELCNQVVRLGQQSAYERLIGLLLELHDRLKARKLAADGSFVLPLTQEVLSDALGLSVVHTNRTLQQLRREHLIESRGNSVSLNDIALLAEIADYRPTARA
jgi:CRP-like cAMP-binding protein